jgi:hypothetical protein
MNRPFTDITTAKSDQPLKHGTVVGLTTPTGSNKLYNFYVNNNPTIDNIYNKYGNKFYNGIFVELVGSPTIIGA